MPKIRIEDLDDWEDDSQVEKIRRKSKNEDFEKDSKRKDNPRRNKDY